MTLYKTILIFNVLIVCYSASMDKNIMFFNILFINSLSVILIWFSSLFSWCHMGSGGYVMWFLKHLYNFDFMCFLIIFLININNLTDTFYIYLNVMLYYILNIFTVLQIKTILMRDFVCINLICFYFILYESSGW